MQALIQQLPSQVDQIMFLNLFFFHGQSQINWRRIKETVQSDRLQTNNVQGSRKGEFWLSHQSLNSSLLPADTLYLLLCHWEKLLCTQRQKGRDDVGLPGQSQSTKH